MQVLLGEFQVTVSVHLLASGVRLGASAQVDSESESDLELPFTMCLTKITWRSCLLAIPLVYPDMSSPGPERDRRSRAHRRGTGHKRAHWGLL